MIGTGDSAAKIGVSAKQGAGCCTAKALNYGHLRYKKTAGFRRSEKIIQRKPAENIFYYPVAGIFTALLKNYTLGINTTFRALTLSPCRMVSTYVPGVLPLRLIRSLKEPPNWLSMLV